MQQFHFVQEEMHDITCSYGRPPKTPETTDGPEPHRCCQPRTTRFELRGLKVGLFFHKYRRALEMSLPYDLNSIPFSPAYFIARIQYIT